MKASTKAKPGKYIRRWASPSTTILKSWPAFLKVDDNKCSLPVLCFLEIRCQQRNSNHRWRSDLSVTSLDVSSLAPCLHVGADTRIFVYGKEAANRGLKKITIRPVGTVVLVLAISVVKQLGVDELGLDFGVGKHRRYLAAHLLAQAISNMKSKCLPIFHSPTAFLPALLVNCHFVNVLSLYIRSSLRSCPFW